MGSLFNVDNPFFAAMGKICDMIFLSVVWVLLCIPIVTIGPATTAMYYATAKVIRRERSYLFREFFHSFKQNFCQGAIMGVILTILYIVLIFDRQYAIAVMEAENKYGFIMLNIFNAMFVVLTFFVIYVFPVLSRFSMKLTKLIRICFIMAIRHLPSTIVMTLITAAAVFCSYYFLALIFIAPALVMFLNSFFMERVLKKYTPKQEESAEETGVDEWYLE